jgi:hypothetical protein
MVDPPVPAQDGTCGGATDGSIEVDRRQHDNTPPEIRW